MSRAQGQLWFPKPAAKAAAKSIGVFLGIMRRSTLKSVVDAFRYMVSYGRRQRRLGFGFLRRRRFPETLMRFASSAQREQDRSLLSGQTVNAEQTRLQDYKAFVAHTVHRLHGKKSGRPLPWSQSGASTGPLPSAPRPVCRNACRPQRHQQVQSDWRACKCGLNGSGNAQAFGCPQGGDAAFIRGVMRQMAQNHLTRDILVA